jgi:hypothetical protein
MRSNFENFRKFADEIERVEKAKDDYLVPGGQMKMPDPEHLDFEVKDGLRLMGITANGHQQLAAKLGVPIDYYRETAKVPGLREYNVNAWLQNAAGEKRLVRTLDGNVRAILSANFKPMDNYMLLDALMPALKGMSPADMLMRTYALSADNLYMQIVFPGSKVEIQPGKHEFLKEPIAIMAGITIRNSETGHAALDIRKSVWNLVCWNGLIRESVLSMYHLGRELSGDENGNIWTKETLQKEAELIRLRARDIIRDAMAPESMKGFVERAEAAIDDRIVKPMDEVIVNVTKRFLLTKDEGQKVMENILLGGKGNMNRWGVANALNALAHDLEDIDRQYDTERWASDIIDLKPSEWKAVAA